MLTKPGIKLSLSKKVLVTGIPSRQERLSLNLGLIKTLVKPHGL